MSFGNGITAALRGKVTRTLIVTKRVNGITNGWQRGDLISVANIDPITGMMRMLMIIKPSVHVVRAIWFGIPRAGP